MEIRIKINQKLLKQMMELNLNDGKKMDKNTFDYLLSQIEWKYRNTLIEVGEEMVFPTIVQLVKSYGFLGSSLKKRDRINKHNNRLKLKKGEYKSGYWVDSDCNCCPKCNKYDGSDSMGIEHPENYLKEKYQKDFKEKFNDILEFYHQCNICGIGFTEVYSNNGRSYEFHEIQ
jgi:hypothetical protein